MTGIFELGNRDVNGRWVLVPLRAAQTMLDLVGGASAIELKLDEIFEAENLAQWLERKTGLVADSWSMIQVFVVVAVALGIASVLIVSVVQKSKEIGILNSAWRLPDRW